MSAVPPVIGITLSSRADPDGITRAAAPYAAALEAHGARVLLLTSQSRPNGPAGLHGLLLAGGGDVHPSWYGEVPHPKLDRVEEERDELEIGLCREAAATGRPVLGICRGAQVLGVALGGKLHQDIASCLPRAAAHGDATHQVRLAEGSRLEAIYGHAELTTNSYHHQANSDLGEGLRAAAWAEDGVIEGIESAAGGFLIGVQWHPERLARDDPLQARLFAEFVRAAQEYAGQRAR